MEINETHIIAELTVHHHQWWQKILKEGLAAEISEEAAVSLGTPTMIGVSLPSMEVLALVYLVMLMEGLAAEISEEASVSLGTPTKIGVSLPSTWLIDGPKWSGC
jgi:hypothetical protein